jgi:hypothetical protein
MVAADFLQDPKVRQWLEAGLDAAHIRQFAGAAAGALGRSVRDPDRR